MELPQFLQHLFSGFSNVNVIFALVTIAVIVLYSYSGAPKNLPPGPLGLPVVGYLPFLGKIPHETFDKLAKKYGPVFSLYLGSRLVVVLNSYEAIKEALVKQGEVFAGRPYMPMIFSQPDEFAIALSDGEMWKVHRRFAINVLRDLGVGKLSIEPQIMEEIQYFMNELKKLNAKPSNFSELLTASISNNICILIFGKRFEYDDPWFVSAKNLIKEFTMSATTTGFVTFFPWLLKHPGIFRIVNQESLIQNLNKFKETTLSRIMEFKKDYTDGLRDSYINAFIGEQKARKNNNKKEEMFPDQALEENARGMMGAGTDTSANTLMWCILYMVKYPEVQTKVQKEIDGVIGRERALCWNDRLRTPYTEAVISEVQRMTTLVPTSLPHRNTSDCELFGYTIPKDTFIMPNLWAVHNDDKLWENPEEFRPERFLNANGEFQKNEHLIPFSMGKRECLGISLAKMELYLYFASLLQKFMFSSPDGSAPSLEASINFTVSPKYFNVVTLIRDNA